jgi:hypothetical protein
VLAGDGVLYLADMHVKECTVEANETMLLHLVEAAHPCPRRTEVVPRGHTSAEAMAAYNRLNVLVNKQELMQMSTR